MGAIVGVFKSVEGQGPEYGVCDHGTLAFTRARSREQGQDLRVRFLMLAEKTN